VNRDGTGQYGIESRWQELLGGSPQVLLAQRDGSGRPILEDAQTLQPGSPGTSLTLTIDASLQLKLEQEVYAAWVADHAKSVSGVVMDPGSGEILASATYPSYDGNDYGAIAAKDPSRFIDPIISSVYEPGSVFKLLTATAALQAGVVTRTTKLSDQAVLRLDGGRATVQNADRGSKGTLSFQDAIAWSRNVVMSKVALKLGPTTRQAATVLHSAWTRLGFGAPTGIDVAGEVSGLVRDPAVQPYQQIDLANGSFGQGIAVTLLQLATAYSAMVNGGTLPTPHVVKATGDTPTTTADRGRVMTPALSADLTAIMERVVNVVPFYRARTLIPGYLVGGKTGTAQIWDSKTGSFRTDVYNFSFVGFVGRTAPELVVAVRVTEGRPIVNVPGDMENAVESFELFRRIATDAMTTLDLPPTRPAPSPLAPSASARP
jgi:cell division protein FtsI/penicillin-binding protein 2